VKGMRGKSPGKFEKESVVVHLCLSNDRFEFRSSCVSLLQLSELIKPHTAYGLVVMADLESCFVTQFTGKFLTHPFVV